MKTLLCLISFAICPFFAFLAFAEAPSRVQSGAIDLMMQEKAKDPYKLSQSQAIQHFKDLVTISEELKSGKSSTVPALKEGSLHYLMGAYLYCTIAKGTCPEILDGIFETDLINSRIQRKAQCPNMLAFWRDWQANDMETRQKFLVRVGHLSETSDFTRNVRPHYIKCKETIENELNDKASDADYFKKRYPSQGSGLQAGFARGATLMETLQKGTDDVFKLLDSMKK